MLIVNENTTKVNKKSAENVSQKAINNVVLQRLIEEVRLEEDLSCVGPRYDRVHNKHNR